MPKGNESVSFFFPAYFDEKSIALLVKGFHSALKKAGRLFEIIVIDDHSPDGTGRVADQLAKKMDRVRVIHNKTNKGYGGVLLTGFDNARNELVGFTDGDGQYSVQDLHLFLDAIKEADIVVGYRTNRADGRKRVFFHEAYKLLLFLVLGMRFKDPDCGFKLLRVKFFPKIRPLSSSGFFSAEMLFKAKRNGLVIKEVPVRHLKRRYGSSKCFKFNEIFSMFKDVFRMRLGKI